MSRKQRTLEQTTELHRAVNDARQLIYEACWKLIRAQDIIVDEKRTLDRLQVLVELLRNYADHELTQIK
jgi:hypothetical protein